VKVFKVLGCILIRYVLLDYMRNIQFTAVNDLLPRLIEQIVLSLVLS